ncbi:unnamed protein product, partial [Closterium sp. Naga37s-1]
MAEPAGLNLTSSRQLCPDIQLSYPNVVQDCYASRSTTGYSVYVIPFNTSCDSFLLLPAEQLWSPAVRSAWYLFGMLYCFVGLAAIVRVFMEALDRISSTYAMVSRHDPETGREERRMEKVWNSTVVNVALMALGASAPDIVIAVVDALKHLNQGPGVLGAGTVLGSAAFNQMVISAVCVVTPPAHSIKRIQAVGVFLLELTASTWAYVWILLVLKVFSPGRVTIVEACITLLFFPLFILLAYAQDQHWQHWGRWGLLLPFLPRPTPHAPRRGSLTRFKNYGSREALIGPSVAQGGSKNAAAGGGNMSGVASTSIAVGDAEEGAGEQQAVEGDGQRSHGSADLSDWEDVVSVWRLGVGSRRLGQHLWLRSQLPGLTHSPAPAIRPTPLASPGPLVLNPPQQQQQQQEQRGEEEKAEGHARGAGMADNGQSGLVEGDDHSMDLLQERWTLLVRLGEREVCRLEHTPASNNGTSSSAATCITSPVQTLNFRVPTAEALHLQLELTVTHLPHALGNSSCTHARQLSTSSPHATSPSLQSSSAASADAVIASATRTVCSLQSQPPWFTAVASLVPPSTQSHSHTAYTSSLLFENARGAERNQGCGEEGCSVEGDVRAELHVGVRVEAGEGDKVADVTVTVLGLRLALEKQHGQGGLGGLSIWREPTSSALSSNPGLGEVWLQQIEKAISVPLSGHQRDVSLLGLGVHFISFYWKLLFSLIPPPSLVRGWPAFILCLCFMAGISFLIEEFARLLACTSGLHLFSVAIVFVAS